MTALTPETVEEMLAAAKAGLARPFYMCTEDVPEGVETINADVVDDAIEAIEAAESALLAAWSERDAALEREAKLREALKNIDAIDPEAMIDGFSEYAIKGLVHCMGAIARTALGGDTP